MNQQHWIDSLFDENITFLPRDGCPGPAEVVIDDHTLLVILDTQWLLHRYEKPAEGSLCGAKSFTQVLSQLEDIFRRNNNKRIIVAAHHPLITYGEHGGVFTLRSHIFPLTEFSKGLYIPLPVIGSLYPLYRKWFGSIQDTAHPKYRKFSKAILKIMADHPGNVYVSGHEHGLQHIVKDGSHFIVSGTGAKTEYVKKKKHARYAKAVRGFVKVDVHASGHLSVNFIRVDPDFPSGMKDYAIEISAPR
jgi:hypothetical protein